MRGFSAWCRAEVQREQVSLMGSCGTDGLLDQHRGGFLNVIRTGVQKRVERERGAMRQVPPMFAPRHRFGLQRERLARVQTDARGGRRGERIDQQFALCSQRFADSDQETLG